VRRLVSVRATLEASGGCDFPSLTLTVLVVAALALGTSGATVAAEKSVVDHKEEHRELLRKFQEISQSDPKTALAFARSAVDKTAALGPDDQRRGDALELLAYAHLQLEEFGEVLGPATEVVRIRRAARPVDHELLALALGVQATALFALDKNEQADRALAEQLASWRTAFGPKDVRLAQKLEMQAEYVQKGFGRTRWAMELLKEAITIRDANPGASPGRLAATLQELAIHQIRQLEYTDANANLERAGKLLQGEMARDPAREENTAGLAQILVLRAGIAGALDHKKDALALAEDARTLRFKDRELQAENEILVPTALASILERMNDIPGAIDEQKKVLDVYRRYDDLIAQGTLDPGGIGDTWSSLARLYLKEAQPELGLARAAITAAREKLGDTSDLLFLRSNVERQSRNEAAALSLYQQALRLRKESATEVTVMFGTNRRPEKGGGPAAFGGEPGDHVAIGDAAVLVPGGQFSTEVWLKAAAPLPIPVGRATDPERLIIRTKREMKSAAFQAEASALVGRARLYPRTALVFVHGYNVTFDAGLQRGAQLVRDLNYDSAAFVFSWPSRGDWWRYGTDRASADAAVKSLVDFLGVVAAATGAEKIHIVAHSMGNRVLLPALVKVAGDEQSKVRARIGEVVLAAPAVPRKEFSGWIDELGRRGFEHFTLYASSVDKAMRAGFLREGGAVLAGYVASGQPVLSPYIQSVDVSEAGASGITTLNHDVFASNPVMTEDMRQLLQSGRRPPDQRIPTLEERTGRSPAGIYWYYRLPSTAALP